MTVLLNPLVPDVRDMAQRMRVPRLRTIAEFAEERIIIPDGPHAGRAFRCHRQPYTRLWFDALASNKWSRFVAVGPTQSGKSLSAFVIVALYHLFEIGETVIMGLPSLDLVNDKWRENLMPVIERSPYREYLPRTGSGSRGGVSSLIQFRNGSSLRFMTGGGGDKVRASFTARVVVITETDGMDEVGGTSREADKITQLEARTRAFGSRRRIYMECTVSIEQGRTWREYQAGTQSRLMLLCPHCHEYVFPGREHLIGWSEADSVLQAREKSRWTCPACRAVWSEQDRRQANVDAMLVHRGQNVDHGLAVGDPPQTDTLGFRWDSFNNMFVTAADVGSDEWRGAREPDKDNAEKKLRQFIWTLPHEPNAMPVDVLDPFAIAGRSTNEKRGFVPEDTVYLTVGLDLGKWRCWWIALAWRKDGSPHVVDYDVLHVASREFAPEIALLGALRQFRDDIIEPGFPRGEERIVPDVVWVDYGYESDVVRTFIQESGGRYKAAHGYGTSVREMSRRYVTPTRRSSVVVWIGDHLHVVRLKESGIFLIHVDADHWKLYLHSRLTTPMGQPGAMTLYHVPKRGDHMELARHWTSERQVVEFEPGRGTVKRFEVITRWNHYLDAAYNACAAASTLGVNLAAGEDSSTRPAPKESEASEEIVTTADGEPFFVLDRSL